MQLKKTLVILALIFSVVITGCANPPASNTVSELPDPATAKIEAKEAIRQWQMLLETGQNLEFVHSSMPTEIYQYSVSESGELKPEVLDRIRAFAPKIVNALNEAQFVEPTVEGENVVFEFDEIHSSNGFFKDERILLTKSNGRWFFNGAMVQGVTQ